jgi:DNA replication and repair protein RecF
MQLAQDRSVGYTQSGPHRADLKMSIQGRDALTVLSRGQQKLLTLMLLLSQAALLTQVMQTSPIVLLDDLSAELDERHRQKVLDVLADLSVQTFLTATDAHHLEVGQDAVRWSVDDGHVHVIENRPKAV